MKRRREQSAKAKAKEQARKHHERRTKAAERATKHKAMLARRIAYRGQSWHGYINNWDGGMQWRVGGHHYVSGLLSHHNNHHNHYEDRRWRFYCAAFHGVGFRAGGWPGWQTSWDAHFNINCGHQPAIGFSSAHNNGREDRIWRIRC